MQRRLSHSPHGILEFFELAFQKHIFELVAIQVRVDLIGGVDFRATTVAKRRAKNVIVEIDRRFARGS